MPEHFAACCFLPAFSGVLSNTFVFHHLAQSHLQKSPRCRLPASQFSLDCAGRYGCGAGTERFQQEDGWVLTPAPLPTNKSKACCADSVPNAWMIKRGFPGQLCFTVTLNLHSAQVSLLFKWAITSFRGLNRSFGARSILTASSRVQKLAAKAREAAAALQSSGILHQEARVRERQRYGMTWNIKSNLSWGQLYDLLTTLALDISTQISQ